MTIIHGTSSTYIIQLCISFFPKTRSDLAPIHIKHPVCCADISPRVYSLAAVFPFCLVNITDAVALIYDSMRALPPRGEKDKRLSSGGVHHYGHGPAKWN